MGSRLDGILGPEAHGPEAHGFVGRGYGAWRPSPRRPTPNSTMRLVAAVIRAAVAVLGIAAAIATAGLTIVGAMMLWFVPATSLGWIWAAALALPALSIGGLAFDAGALAYRLIDRAGDRLLAGLDRL